MTKYGLNLFMIVLMTLLAIFIIYMLTKTDKKDKKAIVNVKDAKLTIRYLLNLIIEYFDDIQNQEIYELNLNRTESERRENQKNLIRKNQSNCGTGDIKAKEFIKLYIKDFLLKIITELNIDEVIPFNNASKLTAQDKFEIILYSYKKASGYDALREIISKYNLDQINNDNEFKDYIGEKNINDIYVLENINLCFEDKLDIVVQRIYQEYRGLSVIDEIRDMKIDEIAVGISGINSSIHSSDQDWINYINKNNLNSFDSVWITYRGRPIQLEFLSLGSLKGLIRVCNNMYHGQFSEADGYILEDLHDGSRLTMCRPPFSAGWAAIVRKFDSIEKDSLKSLITDDGDDSSLITIKLLEWIVKGYNTVLISGEKGTGKTTLLMLIVGFLGKCGLRTFELLFELQIPRLFPHLNVISLREIANVKGLKAFEFIKKAGGDITLLGEIANYESGNWFMELTQVLSKCGLATGHWETTDALIAWFRNAILREGKFSDERLAEEEVINTVNFDIHCARKGTFRYIERITEIRPLMPEVPKTKEEAEYQYYMKQLNKQYETVDILVFENGRYVLKSKLSKRATEKILNNISDSEAEEFEKFFANIKE